MNLVVMIGNIVSDLKVNEYNGGKVCSFAIAVKKAKEESYFFRVKAFNQKVDFLQTYCPKGTTISLTGTLDVYENKKQDGTVAKEYSILANTVEIVRKPNSPQEPQAQQPIKQTPQMKKTIEQEVNDSFDITDEDLPF